VSRALAAAPGALEPSLAVALQANAFQVLQVSTVKGMSFKRQVVPCCQAVERRQIGVHAATAAANEAAGTRVEAAAGSISHQSCKHVLS
jgi:hypothetical protein